MLYDEQDGNRLAPEPPSSACLDAWVVKIFISLRLPLQRLLESVRCPREPLRCGDSSRSWAPVASGGAESRRASLHETFSSTWIAQALPKPMT